MLSSGPDLFIKARITVLRAQDPTNWLQVFAAALFKFTTITADTWIIAASFGSVTCDWRFRRATASVGAPRFDVFNHWVGGNITFFIHINSLLFYCYLKGAKLVCFNRA